MKISIVTPSFNQREFIERTLSSVASQSGVEVEHLVFDGGSTDGTPDVLRRFGSSIRWVSRQDRGQADAVNQAIAASTGEIIGWLNSDDVYYPGALERVAAHFERNAGVDVVYGTADHIDTEDRVIEPYPTEPWDFGRLAQACFICQPAAFFRRRVVDEHGLLDDSLRYCMDYEYWLRLGKAGARFDHLPDRLAGSRLYPGNKTLGARVAVHAEINDMLKRTLGRVPDRWLVNYAFALEEAAKRSRPSGAGSRARVLARSIGAARRWNGWLGAIMFPIRWMGRADARRQG